MRKTFTPTQFKRALRKRGFYIQESDYSWRRDCDNSLASVEAIDNLCEFYNGLIHWFVLDGWQTGRGVQFDLGISGDKTTIFMRDTNTGKVRKSKTFKTLEVKRNII